MPPAPDRRPASVTQSGADRLPQLAREQRAPLLHRVGAEALGHVRQQSGHDLPAEDHACSCRSRRDAAPRRAAAFSPASAPAASASRSSGSRPALKPSPDWRSALVAGDGPARRRSRRNARPRPPPPCWSRWPCGSPRRSRRSPPPSRPPGRPAPAARRRAPARPCHPGSGGPRPAATVRGSTDSGAPTGRGGPRY